MNKNDQNRLSSTQTTRHVEIKTKIRKNLTIIDQWRSNIAWDMIENDQILTKTIKSEWERQRLAEVDQKRPIENV